MVKPHSFDIIVYVFQVILVHMSFSIRDKCFSFPFIIPRRRNQLQFVKENTAGHELKRKQWPARFHYIQVYPDIHPSRKQTHERHQ